MTPSPLPSPPHTNNTQKCAGAAESLHIYIHTYTIDSDSVDTAHIMDYVVPE